MTPNSDQSYTSLATIEVAAPNFAAVAAKFMNSGCHAALNSRTGDPYFSAFSAF
jgi:hypothetical protein